MLHIHNLAHWLNKSVNIEEKWNWPNWMISCNTTLPSRERFDMGEKEEKEEGEGQRRLNLITNLSSPLNLPSREVNRMKRNTNRPSIWYILSRNELTQFEPFHNSSSFYPSSLFTFGRLKNGWEYLSLLPPLFLPFSRSFYLIKWSQFERSSSHWSQSGIIHSNIDLWSLTRSFRIWMQNWREFFR